MRVPDRGWAGGAAVATAVLLAASGCTSGGGHGAMRATGTVTAPVPGPPTTPASGASSPVTTGPATSSNPAPTPSAPPPTTASTGSGPCPPGQLGVALASEAGAAGTGIYRFVATNNSQRPCSVGGYFGVSLYDPAGHLLTAQDRRSLTTLTGAGAQPVMMAPGAKASFVVGVPENPVGTQTRCPAIGAFHLIPPNDTGFDQVSVAGTRYQYCGSNGVEVYPTTPGTSG